MSGHKVKIATRIRPALRGEPQDDGIIVTPPGDQSGASNSNLSYISIPNPRDTREIFKFPFTSCYDQGSTQEEIFTTDVAPLIPIALSGVTVTIFAYGVTSAGKTHTMQGTKADPGVIPRVVESLFEQKSDTTSLAVSYMEIYKDDVYDLLVEREKAPKLPVRENDSGKVFVANLSSEPIASIAEFDALYSQATRHRSTGSTNLNQTSSRSHAVLTIEVVVGNATEDKSLHGKINLVDLAGSENNKLTGNDPSRMAESSAINKSLSVLGQVVHALNSGASRIPYRNSKLTRILQDALGGSSVGLLICNIAPGIKFRQDTLNTLNFATRTKNIENKPVVNERDNKAQPKPHFAARQAPPPKLAAANLAQPLVSNEPANGSRTKVSAVLQNLRPRHSKVPRPSAFSGYQPFAALAAGGRKSGGSTSESNPVTAGLSTKEIDDRISKAVEAEVARRLAEIKERERYEKENHVVPASPKAGLHTLPSGVLTPLLKKHRDVDQDLQTRLKELEDKFERGNKEVQLADVLSPATKKRTGRAYVLLARAHSQKGDLQVALNLYRKAENYVPDNVKLKERIMDIEYSVKNGQAFVPSPRQDKAKKSKSRRKSLLKPSSKGRLSYNHTTNTRMDEEMIVEDEEWRDEEVDTHIGQSSAFGNEVTNTPAKRSAADSGMDQDSGTPLKKRRRGRLDRESEVLVS